MCDEKLRPAVSGKRHELLFIIGIVAALCCSGAALAQSGRRQSKSAAPPVVVEPPAETETPQPKPKPSPLAAVIVGGNKLGTSFYLSTTYVELAIASCLDRLKESAALDVAGGGDMTRKGAIDRAKKEQAAFVLWLDVRVENDGSGSIEIDYTVFTPQTAKVMTSGHVYPGTAGVSRGGVGVGLPPVTNRYSLDYLMKEGGREVAERVGSKLLTATAPSIPRK